MDNSKCTVPDLRRQLKELGLPTTGNKTVLIQRLLQNVVHDGKSAQEETQFFDANITGNQGDSGQRVL